MLVVATPDTFDVRQVIQTARELNPGVELVVRTLNGEEGGFLEREAAERVFIAEDELAKGMSQHVLQRYGKLS
jgi:CPA2 family monovalent cation:H+ antiporter-2